MDYEKFKIRRFDLWDLYLHQGQFPYIGRCYASAIREDVDLITGITEGETQELFSHIIPSWHKAVSKLFGESRPNIAIFGNDWNHLHAHLIPRFYGTRRFYEIDFTDLNPTGNYAPYLKREIELDTLLKIKEEIGQNI